MIVPSRMAARGVWLVSAGVAVAVLAALPAHAQTRRTRPANRTPRVELSGGGGWTSGLALGARDADLRANGTPPSPFRLFSSDTRLAAAPFVDARLGYRLTTRVTVEGQLTIAQPSLRTSLTGDVEGAAPVVAATKTTEYVVDGGALYRFPGAGRRRWVPFVSGGAGVARHVYDGRALVETAVEGYVGGGTTYAFGRARRGAPRAGVRADARLQFLRGGIASGAGVSSRALASGSVFVAF